MYEYGIWLVFRALDMAILSAISWFVYQRYLRDVIIQAMRTQRAWWQQIRDRIASLHVQHTQVQHEIEQQQEEVVRLKQQVRMWRDTVRKEHEAERAAVQNAARRVRHLQQEQFRALQHKKLYDQIRSQAVAQARSVLHEQFASPHARQEYMHTVIDSLSDAQEER